MTTYRSTDKRSYRCPACQGIIKAPRRFEIEQIRATHDAICPGTNPRSSS